MCLSCMWRIGQCLVSLSTCVTSSVVSDVTFAPTVRVRWVSLFCWYILVICRIVVLKLAVTVFTSLLFPTLWLIWLNFFSVAWKNIRSKTEKINPARAWRLESDMRSAKAVSIFTFFCRWWGRRGNNGGGGEPCFAWISCSLKTLFPIRSCAWSFNYQRGGLGQNASNGMFVVT